MDERTWIVDAANVIGARPDGWWRDRAAAALRLHKRLSKMCSGVSASRTADRGDLPAQVVLVLEGAARAGIVAGPDPDTHTGPRTGRLVVVHAPGSGDDAVVEAAVEAVRRQRGAVLVITADRELRGRVHAVGAATAGPGWLWALLDNNG
ncbi:hypothetical protein FDG2_5299 [Candidatus Protofrankia californiensis]|uniref:RNA-binding protein n=1 Tax=Candidatus Protofrankia californiensis TaxID=1839754 RepID=A0A1C3PC57_9ACTN|nr:hypothetical protein FDG2_5299 [Candidatus Protofrankia californiensis]